MGGRHPAVRYGWRVTPAILGLVTLGVLIAQLPVVGGTLLALILAVAALTILVVVLYPNDSAARSRVNSWTLLSFSLHAMIGCVVASMPALVSYLGPDAAGYHGWASDQVQAWSAGHTSVHELGAGKRGFVSMLAAFYWITNPVMVVGALMNAAFAAAIVPVLNRATETLFGSERARPVPVLVTFVPALLLWPSQVLREAPVLFFISVVVLCSVTLQRRSSLKSMAVLLFVGAALLEFRGTLAYPLLAAAVLSIAVARRHLVIGLFNASSILALFAIVVGVLGLGVGGFHYASSQDLQNLSSFRQATDSEANSGFDEEITTDTNLAALVYLVTAVPRLLAGPMPWQVQSMRQAPGAVDAIVWWWLLLWAWRGFRAARQLGSRRPLFTLIFPASVTTTMLALALGNYGLIVRQRPQVLIFLVPLIALGLSSHGRPRARAASPKPALAGSSC